VQKESDKANASRIGPAPVVLLGLVPAGLLIVGLVSAWSYAHTAEDVNHAGQLRYRTLMARDLCTQTEIEPARAIVRLMEVSRTDLRLRHASAHYFEEDTFVDFASYIEQGKAPPFEIAMRHVASADRLTAELAEAGRGYLQTTLATFLAALATLALAIVQLSRTNRGLLRAEEGLTRLASTDGLTGLWNRRKLYAVLGALHETHGRDGSGYSVVLADIDHFKIINDEYGHPRGDEVLVRFAELLRHLGEGEAFRYGGEEFAWVLPNVETHGAVALAERLRTRLAKTPLAGLGVTASFGVAMARPGDSVSSLLERADRALYSAKKRGRDRVGIENMMPKPMPTSLPAPLS
jgi:diguanylate cyclase (GGDEF)-like protein